MDIFFFSRIPTHQITASYTPIDEANVNLISNDSRRILT